jgi:hypothetical protein
MKANQILLTLILLSGCSSVKVSNIPPDLSSCTQLAYLETNVEEPKVAIKELRDESKRMGGNYLYLPLDEETNQTEGNNTRTGISYKC